MENMKEIIKTIQAECKVEFLSRIVTKRDVLIPDINNKPLIITGIRRSGKTYFMSQIWQEVSSKENLKEKNLLVFNFFDERIESITIKELDNLIICHSELNPEFNDEDPLLIFLDEIQLVPNWELYISRLQNIKRYRIFITGSSAKLLSKDISTVMRGRAISLEIFPFSFKERIRHLKYTPKSSGPAERAKLTKHLYGYLLEGGFPETIGTKEYERNLILQEYYNVLFFKDIVERHNISDPKQVKTLLKILINQFSGSITINKLTQRMKSLGFKSDKEKISNFLEYFYDCYLLYEVPIFSTSELKKNINPRKIYCIDNGIINAVRSSPLESNGLLLENLVYITLRKRKFEISYFSTKDDYKVDFVTEDNKGMLSLIQVCYSLSDDDTRERELKSLTNSMKESGIQNGSIITFDENTTIDINKEIKGSQIEVMSIDKFLE